ncbi:hypothetical protein EJ08DRAFT_700671 [Tothia fuscella]|uniref:Uncharacterized protein n=1 Tax=Tothia fuscella TaxID=1048955 RepID=A0A9P4NKD0_9PEZI|nr:hypothetical protein EJ08DRAFT_700671 [Tothia fuscella]
MAPLSYQKAKGILTPTEKERIVCVFLASIDQISKIDYDLTAAEFGAAKGGFQVSWTTLLKKLRNGGCYVDGANDSTNGGSSKRSGKTKDRKRRADSDEDGNEGSPTPKAKKARSKKMHVKNEKEENLVAEDDSDGQKL